MIVWLNGTHGAGKTTTGTFVQKLIPDSRVFDAEKVGETLMDVTPGLPATNNFQHRPPWRPLMVETARHILDYTGGRAYLVAQRGGGCRYLRHHARRGGPADR
ncbi:hypothetical protein ACFYO7_08075 [Nocardia salmonicida]|uniref:hypothetical protein n=1 Tax=Nocardia salmonicida TaxID=53431 RepID=UPI0036BA41B1